MTVWRVRFACWITKATKTHWEYVILNAYPLQTVVARTRLNVMLQYIAFLELIIRTLQLRPKSISTPICRISVQCVVLRLTQRERCVGQTHAGCCQYKDAPPHAELLLHCQLSVYRLLLPFFSAPHQQCFGVTMEELVLKWRKCKNIGTCLEFVQK